MIFPGTIGDRESRIRWQPGSRGTHPRGLSRGGLFPRLSLGSQVLPAGKERGMGVGESFPCCLVAGMCDPDLVDQHLQIYLGVCCDCPGGRAHNRKQTTGERRFQRLKERLKAGKTPMIHSPVCGEWAAPTHGERSR